MIRNTQFRSIIGRRGCRHQNQNRMLTSYRIYDDGNNDSWASPSLPTASDFPSWAFQPKDYYNFEVIHQSKKSLARVGE